MNELDGGRNRILAELAGRAWEELRLKTEAADRMAAETRGRIWTDAGRTLIR